MKFGQLIEYNKRNIYLQILWRKWSRKTSSGPFFIFLKSSTWGESKWSAAYFQYISMPSTCHTIKTLDYWSRDRLNFIFLEKGLGLVSPPHFEYDFSRKIFLMLHSINWPNFIVWLPLLLDILGNMCITIVC